MRIAVIGATGLVGREILDLLAERGFPVSELHLYASETSQDQEIEFGNESHSVRRLPPVMPEVDLAFVCATAEVSRAVTADLVARGITVIDLTRAHRGDDSVPLVLAEWHPAEQTPRGIVLSIPNPLTVLLAHPLRAVGNLSPLRRVITTAFLSASAFGRGAIEALSKETVALLNGREAEIEGRLPLAFNCRPEDPGCVEEAASVTSEETVRDLRRLLGSEVAVAVNVVRIPIFHGLGAAVSVESEAPISLEALGGALREAPSILLDEIRRPPTSTRETIGSEGLHVGGLRADSQDSRWIHFWAAADNLRLGAGLNAVAVAEVVLRWRALHS